MSWQSDLELAKSLLETGESVTYTQAMKINLSLMSGVHERLDGIEDRQDHRDEKVDANSVAIGHLQGKVNTGVGLSVIVGIAGAIALVMGVT